MSKTHRVQQWSKPGAYVTVEQGATAGATVGVNLRNADGSLFVPSSVTESTTLKSTDYLTEGRSNLYYTATRVYGKVKTTIQAGANISLLWDDGAQTVVVGVTGVMTNPMTVLGDIIRGGVAGAPDRVAVGSNGQLLTVVAGLPAWADVAAPTPAGADTQVQFNDGGALGADAGFTFDKTGVALKINNNIVWHAGNDGAGSKLDADLLDGQQGIQYLARANHTGTQAWATITGTPTTLAGYGVTDAQPLDATLTALAAANWALNSIPIGAGADTLSQVAFAANTFPARASTGNVVAKPITDFGLSLVDDVDAAAGRTTLELGTAATQNANAVAIIGGTINGTAIGATTPSTGAFTTVSGTTGTFSGVGEFKNTSTAPGLSIRELSGTQRRAGIGIGTDAGLTTGWVLAQSFGNNTTRDLYLYDLSTGQRRLGIDVSGLATFYAGLAVAGAISATTTVKTGTTTVAGLPTGSAGMRHFVTDANATTFASVVAGGGANGVPVYHDGTSWRIG